MASRRWNAFSVCTRSVSFVAAAGDQSAVPLYPSVSSQVLSTGGTSLILSSAGVRISETAWYGGGGGPSQFFPIPPAQELMEGIREKTGGMRGTPDVSFCADPDYGVAIYHSASISGASGWGKAGGTSFAAPAWAAVLAGIRQRGGTSNPQDLYRLAGESQYLEPQPYFIDIVQGGKPPVPGSEGLGSVHRSGFPPSKPAAGWSGRNKRSAVTFFSDPA